MDEPTSNQAHQLGADLIGLASQAQHDLVAVAKELQAESLRRMRLVTRDEFEVQKSVLLKARIQLDELQQRLDALEGDGPDSPTRPSPG